MQMAGASSPYNGLLGGNQPPLLIGISMQTFTKNLTEEDGSQAIEIIRRIQRVLVDEFPDVTTYILACSLHMMQTDIKSRFGVEVTSEQIRPIQNN